MMDQTPQNDRVLEEIDVTAEPIALCLLEGATSMGLGTIPHAIVHYVLGGTGRLSVAAHPPIALEPGRMVLVPACLQHSLINEGGEQVGMPSCEPVGMNLHYHRQKGQGGGNMVVLCARIALSLRESHGVIDLLRVPVQLDVEGSQIASLAVQALMAEMAQQRTGRSAMIRVLLLQCVTEMFRTRLEGGDPSVSWLRGLGDPALWDALHAMLRAPGDDHSLEALAEVAGMSRSRFAERFQAAYGQGPMSFLRELRMAKAAQMLVAGNEPVKRIARKVGFTSRTAFSRAFTEAWNQTPRAFRAGKS